MKKMKKIHLSEYFRNTAAKRWNEYLAAMEKYGKTDDFYPQKDPGAAEILQRVFAFSEFAAKICIRFPEIPDELIRSRDLFRPYEYGEYSQRISSALHSVRNEAELMSLLRRMRKREMLRIACRDIAGLAELSEITEELSAFADACTDGALSLLHRWLCEKYGIPADKKGKEQQMVVLGMGKLGAEELNFSSDIDLIFAYPETGETKKGPESISNTDFFMRLGRSLIKVLGSACADGIVFRVDMNLRPFGESGPLVLSFDAMENYYHEQGREWERYAWIKARVIAGDKKAGEELLKNLNPFVFRRYLDYGVFASLRDMKEKISREVLRKGMKNNIKLGAGGIREVEFFGQVFQLIRGGVMPELQHRSILPILEVLVRENYISPSVCRELRDAYIFLRSTEHRLQEYSDAQTHALPADNTGRKRLALSMGFQDWESYAAVLAQHRRNVHRHFSSLLEPEEEDRTQENDVISVCKEIWRHFSKAEDNPDLLPDMLNRAGFDEAEKIAGMLRSFAGDLSARGLSTEGRKRIDRLIPRLLEKIGKCEQPDIVLDRILNLISSIRRRTSYVSLLLENPATQAHLIRLAHASAWILTFLAGHPVLLDELLDPRTLYTPPDREELRGDIRRRMERCEPGDLEKQMDELRIFRQINVLRVAAADISDSMPLMRVSDYLSDIAETVLREVLDISWNHLVKRHGIPECRHENSCTDKGFVMIAYGKLGGLELGYGSDLDMVFLHAGTGGYTGGGEDSKIKTIDNATFFARLGQRVLHILSTHTGTGKLYEADMRLRPSGSSGILVSSIEGFRAYQMQKAWTWEKQALVRARPIAGDPGLAEYFKEIRKEILSEKREETKLRREIRDMRERMKKELLKTPADLFDLKQGEGGIVDIEFLVQYLVLLHARRHPEILTWTDNVRQIRSLQDTGIINEVHAYFLRKAYLIFRSAGHKLSLREKEALVSAEHFRELRIQVKKIWKQYMNS